MSNRLGIARTQLTGPSVGGGSIVVANGGLPLNVVGAVGSSAINLTTEGAVDWFYYVGSATALNDRNNDAAANQHAKLLGGWLRQRFKWWGPSGTFTISNPADSVFAASSTLGDDDCLGQVRLANLLTANSTYPLLTANNVAAYSNWGFRLEAPSGSISRTLKIYFAFSSGGAATNNQLVFTLRMSDGSTPTQTVTLTPGVAGKLFYVLTLSFKGSSPGSTLICAANVIQNSGDAGTTVGFIGATLA